MAENVKSIIIGLTGGIGSGKSVAAQILMQKGAYIIDTDMVSKQVMGEGSECAQRLAAAFSECVVDGVLSRPLLKKLVFSDESKRFLLNSITHPYIISQTLRLAEGHKIVVIEVPLLFESGFDRFCHVTVGILADKQVKEQRIKNRDGISAVMIESIMQTQISDEMLREKCDFVVENSGEKAQLERAIGKVFEEIKQKFGLDR